jgi:hypothetical protein
MLISNRLKKLQRNAREKSYKQTNDGKILFFSFTIMCKRFRYSNLLGDHFCFFLTESESVLNLRFMIPINDFFKFFV